MSMGYCLDSSPLLLTEDTALLSSIPLKKSQSSNPFEILKETPALNYTVKYKDWPEVNVTDGTGGHVQLLPVKGAADSEFLIYSAFRIKYAGELLKKRDKEDFILTSSHKLIFAPTENGIKIMEEDIFTEKRKPNIYLITPDYRVKICSIQAASLNVVDHSPKQGTNRPREKVTHPNCC